jgi:hemerythrin-like domain-containing protein
MLPIAPLMVEHRIIERMIAIVNIEVEHLRTTRQPNALFIDTVVDFIRTYADQTHHGKEEDILFRKLSEKPLSPEHAQLLNELLQEHVDGRQATHDLVTAKIRYFSGDVDALQRIRETMEFLVEVYPQHIAKEDQRFFPPVMAYLTHDEQQRMLDEGRAFDRRMIHKKYDRVVSEVEQSRMIPEPTRPANWLDIL